MNYKIKIITGYSDDQKFVIDMEEAHKAYYIFRNPEKRAIFSNGIALIGSNIRSIAPDWNGTMGWNETHKLDDYDWEEINGRGIKDKMYSLMGKAEDIAIKISNNEKLLPYTTKKLSEILTIENKAIENTQTKQLIEGIVKDITI